MSKLNLIIQREFIARVRNKTFIIMTFLSPLLIVALIAVISWLSALNNDEVKQIAFIDETGWFAEELAKVEEISFMNKSDYSLQRAKDSVEVNEQFGVLYIPKKEDISEIASSVQLYTEKSPSYKTLRVIEEALASKLTKKNYQVKGLDLTSIENAKANVDIQVENFSGERTSKMSNYIKMAFGGLAGYLLLMFVIIYGNMVMRSVIEEKTNRIIEIIVSSVKPFQLMMGKILGTTLAGITQFLIWVLIGGLLVVVAQLFFDVDLQSTSLDQASGVASAADQNQMNLILNDILKLPLVTMVILFFIYFIGGYFLYSAIYAAIGAAVDNETDSQQFMPAIIIPLIMSFYVGVFAVVENPNGIVSTIFSMIPFTSPIVMLMRVPFGVSWWEVMISILLLFGSIFFTIWFAAKIYRVGILMYGKKPSYKELLKWLKY